MTQTPHNHLLNAHSLSALYQQLVSLYSTDFDHYSHIKTKQKNDYTDYCFFVTTGNRKTLDTVIRYASSILTPALVPYAQVWHEDALEELIEAIKRSGAVDAILSRHDLIDNALAELA